jgi:hypothetical protein
MMKPLIRNTGMVTGFPVTIPAATGPAAEEAKRRIAVLQRRFEESEWLEDEDVLIGAIDFELDKLAQLATQQGGN